jgi:hypothetical protein
MFIYHENVDSLDTFYRQCVFTGKPPVVFLVDRVLNFFILFFFNYTYMFRLQMVIFREYIRYCIKYQCFDALNLPIVHILFPLVVQLELPALRCYFVQCLMYSLIVTL